MSGSSGRIVTLIDMDCFYCQVEARLNPIHKGKPLAVVQYNLWKGGGIIAVNYEARDMGVKRGMRGDEAKQKCPDIVLVSVASVRGKADLSKYRDAGKEVVDVFKEFCNCVERASIDEAYLDLTQAVEARIQKLLDSGTYVTTDQLLSTFIVGFCPEKSNAEDTRISGLREFLEDQKYNLETLRLAAAAALVEELRAEVLKRTGFHCSAGIAHNKVLAKLVCGIHKPRRQTVLPASCVKQLFSTLPVNKVRNLGGKFGSRVIEELGCETMGDLAKHSKEELQQQFDEKTGCWLYDIARGIDNDPVTPRLIPKSIGCSKNFPGKNSLRTKDDVEHWMKELCDEVGERLTQDLQENKRRAQLLTVSVSLDGQSTSRSSALQSYDGAKITAEALSLISRCNTAPANSSAWQPAIGMIAVSASKFVSDGGFRCSGIQAFFKRTSKSASDDSELVAGRNDMPKDLDMKSTGQLPVDSPLPVDRFFRNQPQKSQTDDVKSEETSTVDEPPLKGVTDDVFNANRKKRVENSFFLNYLQRVKSSSTQSSTSTTTQSISVSKKCSSDGSQLANTPGLDSPCGSSLDVSDRSDTSLKAEKVDEALLLIEEMFPNPLEVEDSVIRLLSSSMQETFYTWRSLFRRENDLLSPQTVELNSRCSRNAVDPASPSKKQQENPKIAQPKPKGSIETFFRNGVKPKEHCGSEPKPGSSKPRELVPGSSNSSQQPVLSERPGCSYQGLFSEDSNSADMYALDEDSCGEVECCSICQKMILLREFPEHVDYHAALSLNERLNGDPQSAAVKSDKTTVKSNDSKSVPSVIPVKKRGRPPKNASFQPQNVKKVKSISSFFPVKGSS